jgi:hypothetical protein
MMDYEGELPNQQKRTRELQKEIFENSILAVCAKTQFIKADQKCPNARRPKSEE